MEDKIFKMEEIEQFVQDHVHQKAENQELALAGIDLNILERFEKDMYIYENALLEGIINGIVMCGGKVEGIEID